MNKMDFVDLMAYNIREIDLFHDIEGKKEVIPPRGMEEEFVTMKIEAWRNRVKEKENEPRQFTTYDEEEEEEDDDEVVDLTELTPEDIQYKWREHLYDVSQREE